MAFECTEVSEVCPVKLTTLGYYPNKPLNIFCAVAFGLALIIQLVLGVWKKTYAFTGFVVAGCALEVAGLFPSEIDKSSLVTPGVADGGYMRQLPMVLVFETHATFSTGQSKKDGAQLTRHRIGYAARVPLNANPWNSQAFQTQICAIVLAPTLTCISIYLTLKHLTMALNPSLSRLRPKLLPYIFVPADVSCLLVQAIGGALAASGGRTNRRLVDDGNRAIIAGIALQVVVLLAFGAMSLDYWLRARRWVRSGADVTPAALALWNDKKFRTFGYAVLGAYICVQIRCIYRVAEMAGGWGNEIMQDEPSFAVLDSFMMLICVYLLSCFPPGIFFPQMAGGSKSARAKTGGPESAGEESQAEQGGLAVEQEPKEGHLSKPES